MAQTSKPASLTAHLDLILHTARSWLVPTIEGQCARPDAAKLRAMVANLEDLRTRLHDLENGAPEDHSLSASFEALAEDYAKHPHGMTLTRADVIRHVAMFNEAAAWAWCFEMAARVRGGATMPEDIKVLRLAKVLSVRGVTVGADLPSTGGDAA